VFSYLEGYKFTVSSSYTFSAEPGKVTTVKVVGYEKGGITTDLKDRPAVRYDVEVNREAAPKPQAQAETKETVRLSPRPRGAARGPAPVAPGGEAQPPTGDACGRRSRAGR
jgi:hypothetical protein